ncbi:MAG: hypothetical protein DBX55_00705 [Verrucomicrobia bacterium]|nr:MAG: hypothetical protein DBX55_00705 [Verrucomicrobiota bacterium]
MIFAARRELRGGELMRGVFRTSMFLSAGVESLMYFLFKKIVRNNARCGRFVERFFKHKKICNENVQPQ